MASVPIKIEYYITLYGKTPFLDWLGSLRDIKARGKIRTRLDRVQVGNLGDYRSVGKGVWELKIDYGPGYRVYFGQIGSTVILLLCGGDKSTQQQDISKAQEYWADYERR